MHAGNRLRNRFGILRNPVRIGNLVAFLVLDLVAAAVFVFLGGKVAIHTDPVHLTTHRDLVLANNRNIILSLAGD